MKKRFLLITCILFLVGCTLGKTPTNPATETPPPLPTTNPTPSASPTPQADPLTWEQFCLDTRVDDLADSFLETIRHPNTENIQSISSTSAGITVYHNWWNPPVQIPHADLANLSDRAGTIYNWGFQDGSGLPIEGTFADVIYPLLKDLLAGHHEIHCSPEIVAGPTAGLVQLPEGLENSFFLSLHRPATVDQEFNWRTWVIGVTFENGQPKIYYLVQFHWEI